MSAASNTGNEQLETIHWGSRVVIKTVWFGTPISFLFFFARHTNLKLDEKLVIVQSKRQEQKLQTPFPDNIRRVAITLVVIHRAASGGDRTDRV